MSAVPLRVKPYDRLNPKRAAREIIRRCADDIAERRRRDSSFQLGRDLRDVSALEARACEFIF